ALSLISSSGETSIAIVDSSFQASRVQFGRVLPVNIDVSFDGELVGRNGVHGDVMETDRVRTASSPDSAGERQRLQAAQNLGSVIEEDAVDRAAFERGPVQLAPGF